ncbi:MULTISPECIES: ferrochelatase [Bacillaceae]|uniref:Coproporphyrin III ferrochelatase n=1 Tax=Alkalicoccobacillus plakortidis TaxID=444060 RepID=A0A9D5DL45_9BACI|nr:MULTISPECIES: ferrochelatase [Bacillaceae]KQL55877.1 ferrochelatase [Alkalicoccobacillus plakortidis]
MKKKIGLLVMAYGTPRKKEEIEPYYTHIRYGRPPSQEALQDLTDRYEAIGGISPLARITEQQADGLAEVLNKRFEQYEFIPYLGLKHISPFIEDAVQQMHEDGLDEAVSIVLAPHFSTFSVKSYNGRAKTEADRLGGLTIKSVESWYTEPKFLAYWSEMIQNEMKKVSSKDDLCVIFSAHSLPEKIIAAGDPYPAQLKETAQLLAEKADVMHYEIGWQSEGNTPDPWLGPDVQDLTRALYADKGYKAFMYCPVGFVAEHLEVLYDNDYECKVVTDEIGATYLRPPMPNDHPLFLEAMADAIEKQFAAVDTYE